MDHDDDTLAACAATDLVARLSAELRRARLRLRAAEIQFDRMLPAVLSGALDYPGDHAARLVSQRAEVAAMQQMLDDLLGNGGERHVACA